MLRYRNCSANKTCRKWTVLATVAMLGVTAGLMPAAAASPKSLGLSRDWDALMVTEGDAKTCYIRSAPRKSEPASANRGDIFIFITHRSKGKTINEVSFIAGYPYKPGSTASVNVGKLKLPLFTEGDGAWLEKPADETRLVNAMKQGSELVITGTSQRGTKTTDYYSLAGFSAALKTINKSCGVKG